MPTNQTANYALSQWERSDKVQMEDFNADNAKIDAAIKGLRDFVGAPLRAKWGSYTGTGANDHTVDMGIRPVFALIYQGQSNYQYLVLLGEKGMFYSGTATSTINVEQDNDSYRIDPTDSGLHMRCVYTYASPYQGAEYVCNLQNNPYYWFAIGV